MSIIPANQTSVFWELEEKHELVKIGGDGCKYSEATLGTTEGSVVPITRLIEGSNPATTCHYMSKSFYEAHKDALELKHKRPSKEEPLRNIVGYTAPGLLFEVRASTTGTSTVRGGLKFKILDCDGEYLGYDVAIGIEIKKPVLKNIEEPEAS